MSAWTPGKWSVDPRADARLITAELVSCIRLLLATHDNPREYLTARDMARELLARVEDGS